MAHQAKLAAAMRHRISWLLSWLEMRDCAILTERSTFLCICYCALRAYLHPAEARVELEEINHRLRYPFSADKLQKHIFGSIERQGIFRYSNDTIKETLGITDAEYATLDPDRNKRQEAEKAQRKTEKEALKQSILSLHSQGKNKKEIAAATGANLRKVDRVLSEQIQAEKAERNQRILELHQLGLSNQEIARRLGCHRDTVGAALKAAEKTTEYAILRKEGEKSVIANQPNMNNSGALFCLYKQAVSTASVSVGDEQLHSLEILTTTKENLYIRGNAGTGKTTLIQSYLEALPPKVRKKVLIVAPTWKVASNLNGVTVHRAFDLPIDVLEDTYINKVPTSLLKYETIIIDEISQLRIDVFTRIVRIIKQIEQQYKKHIRIIAVGDFGQLSPIAVPKDMELIKQYYPNANGIYCNYSPFWDSLHFRTVTLYQCHRQPDTVMAEQLTMLKYGCTSAVDWFNSHCCAWEEPNGIYLCPTNDLVDYYNQKIADSLWYYENKEYHAVVDGPLAGELPVPATLSLAVGYRIMTLWNSPQYKNGLLGTIVKLHPKSIRVRLDAGKEVTIQPVKWTLSNGTGYCQLPVTLAYAITVSKAQGCTFDCVNIVRGNGYWLPGQLYVALSRCRTRHGIHLIEPLRYKDLHVDEAALRMTFSM